MPSLRSTLNYLFFLAPAIVVAAPAGFDLRQEPAPSASAPAAAPTEAAPPAGGLSDIDILQL